MVLLVVVGTVEKVGMATMTISMLRVVSHMEMLVCLVNLGVVVEMTIWLVPLQVVV